ncbi:MAG: DUF885 domain-containing protein [Oceanicaulis sp.]|nr:DUF885 domain-containing protein [Oceanicaulis sp.]MBG37077.1 DUF885 domain-containing protein [Oceanicaulis sp.]HBU61718.1 DUF885 domain-containing protein [Oceanicaulis sp.]|tara:strand:- start:300 stop:2171 length:1872 start_codon:yes stop_codon:yes gene_type:complete
MMIKLLLCSAASAALMTAAGHAHDGAHMAANAASVSSAAAQAEQTETERLYAYFQQVFMDEVARSPETQTYLGMIEDTEAYGRWDDRSDSAQIENYERGQRQTEEMQARFDREALTDAGKVSYDFAIQLSENDARQFAVRDSRYVFSPMGDSVSELTTFLINNHRVGSQAHAEAYVSRLEGIGEVIDTLTSQAEARAANGVTLPLFAYPRLTASARSQLTGAPFEEGAEDSALFADFKSKVDALEIDDAAKADLIMRAEDALLNVYVPAMERYLAALDRMEAISDDRAGVWKLPNGEAAYAASLAQFTTIPDMTAEQIHERGLAEVERIHGEMREIMAEVGFEGSVQDFFAYMRTAEQFQLPNTPEGRQEYLDRATAVIDHVMEVAPAYFDTLPEAPLEVRAVEAWREATATGAFYNQPALDGSRPGYYYVNLSQMQDNPTYLLESLSLHEGAPGHHFQIALTQELEDVPMFQRFAWNSAYGEGWALYTEWLGKEMGFYEDPYSDFGRLSYEVFRAARLVVDTGIHHYQWTREQAIDYMLESTPMTEGDITPEVERYIVWPGQAVSYKTGMMFIQDLLFHAQEELGDEFTWGGFHDAVLTAGPLPLPMLEERVNAWIATVKAG